MRVLKLGVYVVLMKMSKLITVNVVNLSQDLDNIVNRDDGYTCKCIYVYV